MKKFRKKHVKNLGRNKRTKNALKANRKQKGEHPRILILVSPYFLNTYHLDVKTMQKLSVILAILCNIFCTNSCWAVLSLKQSALMGNFCSLGSKQAQQLLTEKTINERQFQNCILQFLRFNFQLIEWQIIHIFCLIKLYYLPLCLSYAGYSFKNWIQFAKLACQYCFCLKYCPLFLLAHLCFSLKNCPSTFASLPMVNSAFKKLPATCTSKNILDSSFKNCPPFFVSPPMLDLDFQKCPSAFAGLPIFIQF